jgi:hypothetical protein
VTEDEQSLARRVQDQTVSSARDFFGASLGRLKDQLLADRSQLEDLAERLRQEEARARIQELVDSYSGIEDSIEEAARDLGIEATSDEATPQARGAGDQGGQQETVGRAIHGAQEAVTGAVGQAAGEVVGQVGQVAENLPGGQLLSRTTDESGRTVQRLVDKSGDIIEATLDESGELLDENPVGSLTDLPAEEEYQDEEGRTIRTVRDESDALIELQLGPDGNVLNLEILPSPD